MSKYWPSSLLSMVYLLISACMCLREVYYLFTRFNIAKMDNDHKDKKLHFQFSSINFLTFFALLYMQLVLSGHLDSNELKTKM